MKAKSDADTFSKKESKQLAAIFAEGMGAQLVELAEKVEQQILDREAALSSSQQGEDSLEDTSRRDSPRGT